VVCADIADDGKTPIRMVIVDHEPFRNSLSPMLDRRPFR
jgi:hypothetical protein